MFFISSVSVTTMFPFTVQGLFSVAFFFFMPNIRFSFFLLSLPTFLQLRNVKSANTWQEFRSSDVLLTNSRNALLWTLLHNYKCKRQFIRHYPDSSQPFPLIVLLCWQRHTCRAPPAHQNIHKNTTVGLFPLTPTCRINCFLSGYPQFIFLQIREYADLHCL